MAAKKYLPDGDHLARHVGGNLIERDALDRVVGCFPQAFELRENERYLSSSWLEFFHGAKHEKIAAVVEAMSRTRRIGARHGLAVGNISEIKNACEGFNFKVRIVHEPNKTNPAYTAVRNFRCDELELLELLASEAWSEVVEAESYLQLHGPWMPAVR